MTPIRILLVVLGLLPAPAISAPVPRARPLPRLVLGEGHALGVHSVAYSPDGRLLASADMHCVKLWDVRRVEVIATLRGKVPASIHGVAFSPDGQLLALALEDGVIELLEAHTQRSVAKLESDDGTYSSVAFSPDGKWIAGGTWKDTVVIWDVSSRKKCHVLAGHTADVLEIAFSPDSKLIASVSHDRTVCLWDIVSGRRVARLSSPGSIVRTVAFSPDGKWLASAGGLWNETKQARAEREIRIWDIATQKPHTVLRGQGQWINAVAFSPDGKTLATGSGDDMPTDVGALLLWDVATGRQRAVLEGHRGRINTLAFRPDGKQLVSAGDDHTLLFWDPETGKNTAAQRGQSAPAYAVAFSPDGKSILLGRADEAITRWDARTGRLLAEIEGCPRNQASAGAFSPNAELLATWGVNPFSDGRQGGLLRLRDSRTGKDRSKLVGEREPTGAAISPDGRLLALWSPNFGLSLRPAGGDELARLWPYPAEVRTAVFSPDGRTVAAARQEGQVVFFDTADGKQRSDFLAHDRDDYVNALAFSPDGVVLACATWKGTITLWEVKSGRELAVLRRTGAVVKALAFDPSGGLLAVGEADGVQVYDASGRRPLVYLRTPEDWGYAVAFSRDGKSLAAACDGVVRVWDTEAVVGPRSAR